MQDQACVHALQPLPHRSCRVPFRRCCWLPPRRCPPRSLRDGECAVVVPRSGDTLPAAGDRQPPHSQGVGAGAAVLAVRTICTTRRWSSATSTRSGTPATSKTSASSGSTRRSACSSIIYRPRKADHPRDQLQGPERGLAVRRSGPLQEGEGRPLGGEPVRPDQASSALRSC